MAWRWTPPRALGAADVDGDRERRMPRSAKRRGRAHCPSGPVLITTSPALPCWRRSPADDECRWPGSSRGCCSASILTPAITSGRPRWATAACSAASSGDLPSTAPHYVSLSSVREEARRSRALPPSISPTARSSGVSPSGDTCGGRTGCSTGQPAAVNNSRHGVSASLDGHLRGYEAETGQVVFDTDTAGDFTTVNSVKAKADQ